MRPGRVEPSDQFADALADLLRRVGQVERTAHRHVTEAWKSITWAANWQSAAGIAGRYRKTPDGLVRIQATADRVTTAANTSGTDYLLFTLDAGYRPTEPLDVPALASSGAAVWVRVAADGTVTMKVDASHGGVVAGGWVGLSHIAFATT